MGMISNAYLRAKAGSAADKAFEQPRVAAGCSSCGMCPQPSTSRKVELGSVRLSLRPTSNGTMRSWSHHRISVGSSIVL